MILDNIQQRHYIRWYLKTRCARDLKDRSISKIDLIFETIADLNKCHKRIKLPIHFSREHLFLRYHII